MSESKKFDPIQEREFEALLDYLKKSRGFDFTAYKRASLMRRVSKRMQTVGVESFNDYQDYLQVHPEEFAHLFNTILINVTKFFRDDEAWEFVKSDIIPRIIQNKKPSDAIRVWCAGTASGEEAYTIAMLLAEALGQEQLSERVKIYATDVDEDALSQARAATYNAKQMETVPPEYVEKYFENADTRFSFRKDLRRAVIFGRHDLIQDAPISKVDLLTCRNTLMYFNAEAQAKILVHFHFALNDEGILFLGKSEMLLTHTNIFTPLDLRRRIFTKVPRLNLRDRLLILAQNNNEIEVSHLANHVRIREAAFETSPASQLVIDQNGLLVLVNQQARAQFGISAKDTGRPFKDLEISYRPVELRSRLEQAYAERRLVSLREVEWPVTPTDVRYLDVQIMPLISNLGALLGATITFTDVTRAKQLNDDLQNSRQELETAYEELQSTVEEQETTNEELQSTNEELETLNEELQSTNEELETMNEEMRQRTAELNQVNDFLESILTSLRVGVMVVNPSLQVEAWNLRAEDLWGLRNEEVNGQHFMNLDIGLPLEKLKQSIKNCLSGQKDYHEMTLEATNRRGRMIECRVICTPLKSKAEGIRGAIVLMEDRDGARPSEPRPSQGDGSNSPDGSK
ncbi:MAG TPA: CheR family methyltransferase [Blastocatellia bacterium]|nr:CheR family methyltransferase [Blastocatellia bacterium]